MSFIATEKTYCRFIGCYKVGRKYSGKDKKNKMPIGFLYPEMFDTGVYYDLTPTNIMSEYKDRLIIDWGKAPKRWNQKATTDKNIIALLPF